MTLFTPEQEAKLKENGSPENRDNDNLPVVKLFIPGTGCTWLLSDLDPEEPRIGFGLCDLGMGFPELGYVAIDELEGLNHPVFGHVESDESFVGKYPLTVYAHAAWEISCITESEELLEKHNNIRLEKNKLKP